MDDIKTLLTPVTQLPPFEEDQELYQDYGNDIKFVAKTARGECAA
jgi:sulfite reductase (ferredoxin)